MGDDEIAGNGMGNTMAPRARDFRAEPSDEPAAGANGEAMRLIKCLKINEKIC
jgi:hypothetical protein